MKQLQGQMIILLIICQLFISNIVNVHAIKTQLTWVNGIAHNIEHMKDGKERLTTLFGGRTVEFYHNPTAMMNEDDYLGFLGDLIQGGTQKLGRMTVEVDELVKHLKHAIDMVGKSGRVIHIAHSQGALITYLAARKLTTAELNQIEVLSFGGAAALSRSEFSFYRVVNYYAVNDPLLHVVPSAVKALKSGFLSSYQLSEDPEFVFLSPRSGDPISDHMLFGPTYGPALEWEGIRYQQTYMNPISRTYRKTALTAISTYEMTREVMKDIIQYILHIFILPLCIYCSQFYLWQRNKIIQLRDLCMEKVLKPLLLTLYSFWMLIKSFIQSLNGNEDKYEPLESLP